MIAINMIFISILSFITLGTCWKCCNDCHEPMYDDDDYPIDSLGIIGDPYH